MSRKLAWIGGAVKATVACAGAAVALAWMAAPAEAHVVYVVDRARDQVVPFDTALGTAGEPAPVGNTPTWIAITPDGQTAYVANALDNTVTPIDTETNETGDPIEVGSRPTYIAITPDGKSVFVANATDDTVSVIAAESNTVVKTIPVESNPRGIAVAPDGMTAYVAKYLDESVVPIDTQSGTPGQAIEVGIGPLAIAITPDGETAYVTNELEDTVTPFDTQSGTAGEPIAVGAFPGFVAITPDGGTAYVANWADGSVSVIDTETAATVKTIQVQPEPNAIAITPDGETAYVWSGSAGTLVPIDTTTNEAGGAIQVGPMGSAFVAGIAIPPNQAPSADLSAPAAGYAGVPVTFDASSSSDDDLGQAKFRFDFGDGSFATSANPTRNHTYTEPGTYEVAVTVDDGEGCEPLPEFFPDLASPFTGQTAYCNGPSEAVSDAIEIDVQPLPPLGLAVALDRPQSLRGLEVSATCLNIECETEVIGRLRVKRPGAKPRGFKLGAGLRLLAADTPATLAPGIPAAGRRAARKALRAGGKVRAKLRVVARGPGDQRRVRLRQVRVVG